MAISHSEAVRIILQERGRHFDPVLVDVFEIVSQKLEIAED
jgi:response regulator RpfG family c-di-GMP phosphodiesterase